ncbi:multiple sugar transport system permease protein/N-acetylglucosamine transport system permease protein [Paenibacillus sp. yr247]|nr:multiple sugar transport system permease protein/N-acetylglucosamine transport system permease protein [Paenibacillus sp. yr247]
MSQFKKNSWASARWFFLILLIIALDFPFFIMLITSLKTKSDVYANLTILPSKWMFSNFKALWNQVQMGAFFTNSMKISFGTTALVLVISIPAAYALSRLELFGKKRYLLCCW